VADEPEVVADERLDVGCRNGHPDCFGPRPGRLSSEGGVRGTSGGGFTPMAHRLTRTCTRPGGTPSAGPALGSSAGSVGAQGAVSPSADFPGQPSCL
jgi:hypothetical protein